MILGLALVVVVGGGVAFSQGLFTTAPQASQTVSRNYTVAKQSLNETVGVDGTLAPAKQAQLNFSSAGTVEKVYKTVGDTVKKNEKLAEIDDTDLKNAVEMAQANLASAQAAYTEAKSGSAANRKAAQAEVDSAKAGLKSAKANLKSAVLRAPFAGIVATTNIAKGDTVGQGGQESAADAAFTIVDPKSWQVMGTLSAADIARVKTGQSADITIGEDLTPVKGKISEVGIVASGADDGQATFPVKILLDDQRDDLYSGTSASASIKVTDDEPVLAVPNEALAGENGQVAATLAKDGQKVLVEVGKTVGQWTEITEGLSEGDEITITITLPQGVQGQALEEGGGSGFSGGFGGVPGIPGVGGGGRNPRGPASAQAGGGVAIDGNGGRVTVTEE
ncbi:MAG: HlyD family efflux transporter periplasmic adaptor subunit [Propionibacteriaceae bacterium]|jgi:macrolide-specific efflux system membrane fusion protein|nr:HlyD family efflux transporter periplasmic adaptor subunit [Propionibacteriaceae bacterium]